MSTLRLDLINWKCHVWFYCPTLPTGLGLQGWSRQTSLLDERHFLSLIKSYGILAQLAQIQTKQGNYQYLLVPLLGKARQGRRVGKEIRRALILDQSVKSRLCCCCCWLGESELYVYEKWALSEMNMIKYCLDASVNRPGYSILRPKYWILYYKI